MTDYTYAVINEDGIVENIISADNPDASIALKLLIPEASEIILSTEQTGPAYIGGDFFSGQFRPIPPFNSWVWDINKKSWKAPIDYPQDDKVYFWDDNTISWIEAPTIDNGETWQSQ